MAEGYEPRPLAPVVQTGLTKIDASNYIGDVFVAKVYKINDIKCIQLTCKMTCPALHSWYNLYSVPSDYIPIFNSAASMNVTSEGNSYQFSVDTNGYVKIVYNPALSDDLIIINMFYL